MERYRLYALSRYAHLEGYLDLALKDLILSLPLHKNGIVIQTIHDKNNNPYLIVHSEDVELVEKGLAKRIILPETSEQGSFEYLKYIINKNEIHKTIQENEGEQRRYTFSYN